MIIQVGGKPLEDSSTKIKPRSKIAKESIVINSAKAADKSSNTRAVGSPHARGDGPSILLTVNQFQ